MTKDHESTLARLSEPFSNDFSFTRLFLKNLDDGEAPTKEEEIQAYAELIMSYQRYMYKTNLKKFINMKG